VAGPTKQEPLNLIEILQFAVLGLGLGAIYTLTAQGLIATSSVGCRFPSLW
jgi:hypothetical protein